MDIDDNNLINNNYKENMEIPKYYETFMPVLDILSNCEVISRKNLNIAVADKYYSDLPENMKAYKTSSGSNLLFDRIGWGKSYLKSAKFVEFPERGMVKITEKGIAYLKSEKKLSKKDVQNDLDFLEHRKMATKRSKNKKEKEIVITEENSPQDLIDSGFKEIKLQVKADLLDKLKNINPYYFEKVILLLLEKMGYGDFEETPKSRDGGIDGIINQDKLGLEKIYIQAKRYNENKVREKDIRNFIGAMSGDTAKGIFVTTSCFDELAIKKSNDAHHKIVLIDGEKLVDLMHQYEVGTEVRDIYKVKIINEDFFEEE